MAHHNSALEFGRAMKVVLAVAVLIVAYMAFRARSGG